MKILQIKKLILLCSLLLILNSCSKNDSIEPVPIQTADIYISGFDMLVNKFALWSEIYNNDKINASLPNVNNSKDK